MPMMQLEVSADATATDDAKKSEALVKHWQDEITQALKREQNFRKDGNRTVEMYEGAKKKDEQFNILYSNTETLSPALYNSVPRPVVQRRFKDEDALGAAASKASQRTLEYLIDDGMADYATFDELMKSAVLEALVPGRGVTRFTYDAVIERVQNAAAADAAESDETDPADDPGGEPVVAAPERVSYETVCGNEVPWNRFLHGYAKKWKDVPWVAYEHLMTHEELEQNFGAVGVLVPVATVEKAAGDDGRETHEDSGGTKVATVYEIWDKVTRKVIFISPAYKLAPLKHIEDPLGLSGFFNCPKPLAFMQKMSTLVPVSLYVMYEEQAKELNRVTLRINRLISALKVRGMYDSTVEGLDKVLSADDNVLIPAQNVAALLSQGNALEKAIWLFPIEKLIPVLQQLYLQRNQVKQVIYEITGIADIMRGSSQASETLGAQELKNQWGTLRLKRLQKEVARYARDCLRIILEISVTKLSEKTLSGMTGLPYPTGDQKMQAQMLAQQVQQIGQQPPPELAQILSQPSWADILGLLKDDLQRSFRVDIETNSTVDAEATEDKQNIAELLNAISQFLNGVAPLVENGSMPFEVASGMMLAIIRRFRFGPELEDQLKNMKAPQPKPDPKAQADQQKMQADQQRAAVDLQMKQLELQGKQAEAAQREREMQMEAAFKQQEHAMRMAEMQRKMELSALQHDSRIQAAHAQIALNKSKAAGVTTQ